MGFPRQEYWSGLTFGKEWDGSGMEAVSPALLGSLPLRHLGSPIAFTEVKKKVLDIQLCLTFCDSIDCNPPGFSALGILQGKILEWGDSLLQGVFPTQRLNPGPLQCRQILYCLSHQGNG